MNKMRKTVRLSFVLIFLLALYNRTYISYLPTKDTITYEPTDNVDVYFTELEEPYIIIGQITAVSEWNEEEAFRRLKIRAMEIGAHSIIIKSTDESSHITSFTAYYGTTIVPYTTDRIEAFAIRFENQEKENAKID